MRILTKNDIQREFDGVRALNAVRAGFIELAAGRVQNPPVQHLSFPEMNGECCVKTAYVLGGSVFAVKVSTGFYKNRELGLPTNDGLIVIFSASTGAPVAVLQDEGWLTAVRTAMTGCLVAQVLAPKTIHAIGIVGAGDQGRKQLEWLKPVTTCRKVFVWSRHPERTKHFVNDMNASGFSVTASPDLETLARNCNFIVTTTASREILIRSEWIGKGTHITAVGADAPGKQELDPLLMERADLIAVDSLEQCEKYGEISHAFSQKLISKDKPVELGHLLSDPCGASGRHEECDLTICDLTGVAVQDLQIALCAIGIEPW